MKLADNIKKLIADARILDIDTTKQLDDKILTDALQIQQKQKKLTKTQPNIGKIIMKSKITKLATAAVITLMISISSITFFQNAVTPAWAIEDAIAALSNYHAMYFKGTKLNNHDQPVTFEAWAKANEDQTESNHLRIESSDGEIVVVSNNHHYRYTPATNTTKIIEGNITVMKPWPGQEFFELLKEEVVNWNETYAKDPATNRDRVFVTCCHPASPTPRSWWFEFDIESKLLLSMKQWENVEMKGQPQINITSITFLETLPDETFNFDIPENSKVISGFTERKKKLQNPNAGMLLAEMTETQAAKEIAKSYWLAVTQQDWQTAAQLFPVSTDQQWANKYGTSNLEFIETKEPYKEDNATVVPCILNFNDSTLKIQTAVIFRKIDNQKSCVITNTWISN